MFLLFFEESRGVFFRALVAEVSQIGSNWGNFQDMSQQSWKTENCGFVYTKHYFLVFLWAGLGRVGQLFSRLFSELGVEMRFHNLFRN